MRLNSDSTLAAVSLFDGSLQIVDMMMGGHMHKIKDEQMRMPITSLTWKPTRPNFNEPQKLLGACLDGSIVRWTFNDCNQIEHIVLNRDQKYHAIDYAGDMRRFCVAGSQPYIEIYDEERM